MGRAGFTARVVAAAAICGSLVACDAEQPSPVAPVHAAAAAAPPFETALPPLPPFCAEDTYERTPEQVLADHRAALAAGNLDAVFCNYAVDAVVIGDGGIDTGQDEIRAAQGFFLQMFGGTQPSIVQQIAVEVPGTERQFPPAEVFDQSAPTHMVRVLYTVDAPCVSVTDGADTYIIRSGQIHAQNTHAFPVFDCLPGGD